MITGYFGVPGCGKTTILTRIAQRELRKIRKGKSPYDYVLTNFYCKGCHQVQLFDFKKYKAVRCLILLDEITLDADSRAFKSFPQEVKEYVTLHRHVYCDIVYFCQDYSRVDKTIRELTFELWYVTKPVFPVLRNFSIAKRVFRNIAINEFTSDLVLGYRFSSFWEKIFSSSKKIIFRPRWYKFFDSFDEGCLIDRPELLYVPWDPVLPDPDVLSPSSPIGIGERSSV